MKQLYFLLSKLLFILALLLPVNNLFVQYFTKVLGMGDWVVIWKEILLLPVAFLLLIDILLKIKQLFKLIEVDSFWLKFKKTFPLILPFLVVLLLNLQAIFSSFVFNQIQIRGFLIGYLFELSWISLFGLVLSWLFVNNFYNQLLQKSVQNAVLDSQSTSQSNQKNIQNQSQDQLQQKLQLHTEVWNKLQKSLKIAILAGLLLVSLVSLLSLVFGQESVLKNFGYGLQASQTDSLISSSVPCHQIDSLIATCRLSGSFTHPLHLAAYLLLLIPFLYVLFNRIKTKFRYIFLAWLALLVFLVIKTYSRYALIGLYGIFLAISSHFLPKIINKIIPKFNSTFQALSKLTLSGFVFFAIFVGFFVMNASTETLQKFLPDSLIKPNSTIWHARHTQAAMEIIIKSEPQKWLTGWGIGASGSSTRLKYQDIHQNQLANRFEYFTSRVLFTKDQVVFIDNWFMSVFINGGLIYFVFYVLLACFPFWWWFGQYFKQKNDPLKLVIAMGYFGISVGNLFQLLWENQTVNLYWPLLFIWFFAYFNFQKREGVW